MSLERIIGVAVRHHGEVYGLPAPARHGQVLRLIAACMPDQPRAPIVCEQGFITDHARFVTREKALEIVIWEIQRTTSPKLRHYPRVSDESLDTQTPSKHETQIFSEDLW